jgi:CDP-4-dehydro-6-deoxyglucose reductase
LSLSRAARLVGVSRGVLQAKIHDGQLAAHDGMVSLADVAALYPDARLEESGAFERVTQIKEQAFGKRVRERMLPSQEVLAERLFEQSRELADVRAHLERYHELIRQLDTELRDAAQRAGSEARTTLQSLCRLLQERLGSVLGEAAPTSELAVMDDVLRVMSAHVLVQPSRHEFWVNGHDTVLEAALHAGVSLAYGCSSGNCGQCKARIASGQVKRVRHHDYVLTEAEKLAGYTLLCSHTAVTDLVIEALEANVPGDVPRQQIATHVKQLMPLSEDVMLLHLQTPRTNRLRFLAGQSVTLSSEDAVPLTLPIASCPCDERNLHFHVARGAGSPFARRVFHDLKPGDVVNLVGPSGDFVLDPESTRPILFLACDTGFAPINSLIEHAMAREAAEALALYWLATRPDGHYLARLCRAWASALDNFRYTPLEARGADAAAHGARELCERLRADHPELAGFDIYVAGPRPFVAAVEASLAAAGHPHSRRRSSTM